MYCPFCGSEHDYFRRKNQGGKWEICCQSNDHLCAVCSQRFSIRNTVIHVSSYPPPKDILETITDPANGWPYASEDPSEFIERDQGGFAMVYIGALRISEMIRLNTSQFNFDNPNYVEVKDVKLSKRTATSRLARTREVILPIPKNEEQAKLPRYVLSEMAIKWARKLGNNASFFPNLDKKDGKPVRRFRAYQIISKLTGKYCHYFRGAGENFLYEAWDYDGFAVADYLKVDPRTLATYLHGGYKKHGAV